MTELTDRMSEVASRMTADSVCGPDMERLLFEGVREIRRLRTAVAEQEKQLTALRQRHGEGQKEITVVDHDELMHGIVCGPKKFTAEDRSAYKCRYSTNSIGASWTSCLCPTHQAKQDELDADARTQRAYQRIQRRVAHIEEVLQNHGMLESP